MSPAFRESSHQTHVLEMCDRITFDFYQGLPHIARLHALTWVTLIQIRIQLKHVHTYSY